MPGQREEPSRSLSRRSKGVNEDALEYYDTKLQLYLHAYDEGARNIQEFKRLTFNGLRNLEMMNSYWNELHKWTTDWAEITTTIQGAPAILSLFSKLNMFPYMGGRRKLCTWTESLRYPSST